MSRMPTSADLERLPTAAPTTVAPDPEFPDAQWQVAICIALQSTLDGSPESLVAAFRAAVMAREEPRARGGITCAHLARVLDVLGGAALVMSLDGRAVHESKGFARVVAADADGELVRRAATRQALTLAARCREQGCAARDRADTPVDCTATTRVRTSAMQYDVRAIFACIAPEDPLIIVGVESRTTGKPDVARLRDRYELTAREIDVMHHLVRGQRSADIARDLGVSVHTIRRHTEHILSKLGVHSRAAIADRIRLG